MQIVNVHEAKTQLSQLIAQTLAGEKVVIARAGKPVVRLVPHSLKSPKRKFGILKGKFVVPDDFDEESEEINRMFYGGKI